MQPSCLSLEDGIRCGAMHVFERAYNHTSQYFEYISTLILGHYAASGTHLPLLFTGLAGVVVCETPHPAPDGPACPKGKLLQSCSLVFVLTMADEG